MAKKEIYHRDELEEEDELTEVDEHKGDNKLEQTIPWSFPLSVQKQEDNQSDSNDEMSQDEDFIASIPISEYLERNPHMTCQNVVFKQLTINQNLTINGAKWQAAAIYLHSNFTIFCKNGGRLTLVEQNDNEREIVGEHSSYSYGPFADDQPLG